MRWTGSGYFLTPDSTAYVSRESFLVFSSPRSHAKEREGKGKRTEGETIGQGVRGTRLREGRDPSVSGSDPEGEGEGIGAKERGRKEERGRARVDGGGTHSRFAH